MIASLEQDSVTNITGTRLWMVMRRFFGQAADIIAGDHPTLAESCAEPVPTGRGIPTLHTPSLAARN